MLVAESPQVPDREPVQVPIRVISSARRKKSVSARWVGETIEVRVPEALSEAERDRHVQTLTARLINKRSADRIDLTERAGTLAREYHLPVPTSIEWSTRQLQRWGSCTPANGTIRISSRLSAFPTWVVDHVILHELAHLVVADHSPAFHELISNFPNAERAEGFLLAVSLGHAGRFSSGE